MCARCAEEFAAKGVRSLPASGCVLYVVCGVRHKVRVLGLDFCAQPNCSLLPGGAAGPDALAIVCRVQLVPIVHLISAQVARRSPLTELKPISRATACSTRRPHAGLQTNSCSL